MFNQTGSDQAICVNSSSVVASVDYLLLPEMRENKTKISSALGDSAHFFGVFIHPHDFPIPMALASVPESNPNPI